MNRVLPFIQISDNMVLNQCSKYSFKLSPLHPSIVYTTTYQLLESALDRTATRPKKANVDHDNPEDMPQMLLNGSRAVSKSDPEAQLSASMFDELHFLD